MKIGIDLDDVLSEMVPLWISEYNRKYNDNIVYENISSWTIKNFTKSKTDDIYTILTSDLFKQVQPVEDAYEVTKELSKDHELFIITAATPHTLGAKAEWLNTYYPHLLESNLICTNRKDLVNVDVLIDDAPHNINDFHSETIIFDRPWNRNIEGNRAYNWKEVKVHIDRISKHID